MRNRPRVYFVVDKWCEGNPAYGFAEWERNLVSSLESSDIADVSTFHMDEHYCATGKKGDAALLADLEILRPDIVCLATYKVPGSDVDMLEWKTIKSIAEELAIPIVAIWGDLEYPEHVALSRSLLPYCTLNIATASSAALERIACPEKYVYMWVPKDPRIFNDPGNPCDIDVGFVGTSKPDRIKVFEYLRSRQINVTVRGGERSDHLSTREQAAIYQRTKIALSFSRANYSHVVNARPFEAALCGAMIMEQESFEAPKLFVPYVDYVPFTTKRDLESKIRYFLSNEDKRLAVAKSGFRKTVDSYSASRFWKIAIERTLCLPPSAPFECINRLRSENLAHMNGLTAVKLRLLDRICARQLTYWVYLLAHCPFVYWLYYVRVTRRTL